MRTRLGVTILIATALLAASGAGAQDTGSKPNEARDPKGDVRGGLDLVRVALVRSRDGRIRGELTLAKAWDTGTLRDAGPGSALCLRLFTVRDQESEPPDYLVCLTAPAEGEELVGRVLRDRSNGLPRSVGSAVVSRPTSRTAYVRFSRSSVGKPAALRFAAESTSHAARCPDPVGCRDHAPDAPAVRTLTLRTMARSE